MIQSAHKPNQSLTANQKNRSERERERVDGNWDKKKKKKGRRRRRRVPLNAGELEPHVRLPDNLSDWFGEGERES